VASFADLKRINIILYLRIAPDGAGVNDIAQPRTVSIDTKVATGKVGEVAKLWGV
jgi:hypothetical protein